MRPSGIDVVAWSPCGQLIAVAQSDSTISVLDSVTLEQLHKMHPPPGTKVFTFSSDSRLLLCCGASPDLSEGFVAAWGARTGGAVGSRKTPPQPTGHPSFIASSSGGDMIGVAYTAESSPNTFVIRIYDVYSRVCVGSHSFDGMLAGIWTHAEYLQLAIILPVEVLTVWQVAFVQGYNHRTQIGDFSAPPDLDPTRPLLFHPTLLRASYISGDTLKIWDSLGARYLLCNDDVGFNGSAMTFSPDGCFFACATIGSDIHLWKTHGGDYAIQWKFTSSVMSPALLLSPVNGSVIAWSRSMLQLFSLEDSATPATVDAYRTSGQGRPFILQFSPGEEHIAFARLGSNEVVVVGCRSGDWRLDIDAGMKVYGLKTGSNTIIVEGDRKLMTWNLFIDNDISAGSATAVGDPARTTMLKCLKHQGPKFTSISPDLSMLAALWPKSKTGIAGLLTIFNMETGMKVGDAKTDGDTPWFSPDGKQIWCGVDNGQAQGWEVLKRNGSPKIELVPLTGSPPEGWPWQPPRGHAIADDGWIVGPGGKQLLLLPPDWISNEREMRVWRGRFLALLHGTLSEPVILELE